MRVNISIPDTLHKQMQLNPELNYSKVCQKAIQEAILKHWAQKEQNKLLAGLAD